MRPYELIVFDWDGTLMDSTGHIVSCMQQAIKQLELPRLSDKAVSHIIGLGLFEAVQTLYPTLDRERLNQLATSYKEIWLHNPHQPSLFSHAYQLIQCLNNQDYFMGVATGKSRQGLNKVLKSTQLKPFFHATRCADECHSKPHPEMLEEIINYCGVSPKQTLMIGDTEYDLQMAHNAGADSLAISHGAHSVDTLAASKPLAIVDDLYQVEQWLNDL
jgi:phosphoglycolate phosphatase